MSLPTQKSLTCLNREELIAVLETYGQKKYRADQILQWIYKQRVDRFEEMTNLSQNLRAKLEADYSLFTMETAKIQGSEDTTQKFLFKLHDGRFVETVLIPANPSKFGPSSDRQTICVSSQVGCAFDCKFCASGLAGFTRNLNVGEIVEQILQVEKASGKPINNIVFMGMGEPMANLKNVLGAIEIINAEWGIEIGARQITVSTSGVAPMIKKFADHPLPTRLAISLHGATDEVREKIMPVNKRYPLDQLIESLAYFKSKKKQKITFEFILIENVNDMLSQAYALGPLTRRLNAKVNLIPYNTVDGLPWKRPSVNRQEAFLKALKTQNVVATLRREKGHDIDAACGQLRLKEELKVNES